MDDTENYEMVSTAISISKVELDAMKTPEDLIDVVSLYSKCAFECLIETIGQKYPHLVKAQPEVGL